MKLAKKVNEKVFKAIQKIDPSVSKNTSYDQAYEILAKQGQLVGDIYTDKDGNTKFQIYKEKTDELLAELNWDSKSKVFLDGDWDWTTIYKGVCEYIIKNKLAKTTKKSAKKSAPIQEEEEEVEVNDPIEEPIELEPVVNPTPEIPDEPNYQEELKKLLNRRSNMYHKIRVWKQKGNDVTDLETQFELIKERISTLKTICKKSK